MPELYFFSSREGISVSGAAASFVSPRPFTTREGLEFVLEKFFSTPLGTERYALIYAGSSDLKASAGAAFRMAQAASDAGAALLYSDYYLEKDGVRKLVPNADYSLGSVREDFGTGPLLLLSEEAVSKISDVGRYQYAALYDLRLRLSDGCVMHLNEALYEVSETDSRLSGEKQFDYVNPRNREAQIEFEAAFTEQLKRIGAWLPPVREKISFDDGGDFPCEASVIIPVRNRAKTIADAIGSALRQKADFAFNVIVADNFSDDVTGEIVESFAAEDPRVIHLVPPAPGLNIGGCWNLAIDDPRCGRFAVQLDSDDLYQDSDVLQRIIDGFYEKGCAMLIGSYSMTDFDLNPLPPGLIDHAEWTDENGHNNALRINGLGAPRAFYVPVLRRLRFPDVSYGEDYALGLRISRSYRIGRIFDSLYLCRRWGGNSDAALDIAAVNRNNAYKDKLREIEIRARRQLSAADTRRSFE